MLPQMEHNSTLVLDCKDEEVDNMPEKEVERMIIRLLKNIEKQIHEFKKSTNVKHHCVFYLPFPNGW